MKSTLTNLFIRAKDIFQQEGLISLLRRGFTFLAGYLFRYETYCFIEHTMKEVKNEDDFMSIIQGLTAKMVYTHQQADELVADGFDFLDYWTDSRRRYLDKGAIAFCIFVGQELACIAWIAMTQEAKDELDPIPYHVDFSSGEACMAGALTLPKYRGKGLMTYNTAWRHRILKEHGIITARGSMRTNNIVAQNTWRKLGFKPYAKARKLKLGPWTFWKEITLQ